MVCFGLGLRGLAGELLDLVRGMPVRLAQGLDRLEVRPVADLLRGLLGRLDDRVHLRADGLAGCCLLFLWMIEHRSSFVRAAGARELSHLRVRFATCNAESSR